MTQSLRPDQYVDPTWYDAETQHVLRAGWLPVCRADQVPNAGDRFALVMAGTPVVVTRAQDGAVHVLGNVCRHRGSLIVDDGPSSSPSMVCGYHRWAYRLDGSLIGGPLTEGLDLADVCLPSLRHVVWEGFVLVNLSGDAPDPIDHLAGLSDFLVPWSWSQLVTVGSRTFRSDWNWKVMVENWIECYHHLGSHRKTVEPYQPARNTTIVPNGGAPWVAMTVESIGGVAGEPATWIPGMPVERSRDLSVWSAFPLLLGGSNSRYAFWLHVVPIDVHVHDVTWYLLAHRDHAATYTPERVGELLDMLSAVHAEDMIACRSVQRGIESGLIDEFRFTRLESTIMSFHRWIASRVGNAATL
jgi:phenylpropionate dioxygenase-like ring-hydroxylating dioxygenase large terminal subunit